MNNDESPIYLDELLEKTTVDDSDIMIVEDTENTKKVSFRNLRLALIDDNETPAKYRLYSSDKITEMVEAVREEANTGIGTNNEQIQQLQATAITQKKLDDAVTKLDDKKADKTELPPILEELSNTRKVTDKITSADLEYGTDADKIHMKHLGSDILDAMTGKTQVTIPSVPVGGWVTEDIANGAVTAQKLSKDFLYKSAASTTDLNRLVETGIYVVPATANAMPHYGDDSDESRRVDVYRYGENGKYICQRVYYHTYGSEVRPFFERKGLFSKLSILEFTAHFEVTTNNKVEQDLLGDNYDNRGSVSNMSVFDITADGNYLCDKTVTNLPTADTYIVTVRSYDDRREFDAKKILPSGVMAYTCYEYHDSANILNRTPWINNESIAKSKFDGCQLHVYGDGITYGLGASDIVNTSLAGILKSKYGWSVYNHSLMDATAADYNDEILQDTSVLTQIDRTTGLGSTDTTYVLICVGSEDYRCGKAQIGTDDLKNTTTYKGALNTAIEKILTRAPKAKVILMSPIYRASTEPGDFFNGDDNIVNDKTLREYATAMKAIAEKNHIPFIDAYNECMINKYTYNEYLTSEGVYLNDTGHSMIAEKIQDGFTRYY